MSKEYGVVDKSMYDQLESHAAALEADNAALRAEVERLRELLKSAPEPMDIEQGMEAIEELTGAYFDWYEKRDAALQAGKAQGE